MESDTASRLLERIKHLRLARGLTQEAFAEEAKISYKYYQAVEAGRKVDLRLSTLERLAHAHDLEVWELLLPQAPLKAVAETAARYGARPALAKKHRKPRRK